MNHSHTVMHTAMPNASAWESATVLNQKYPMNTNANYASPSLWKHTVVARDNDGGAEAFSIGPDGYVWSYVTSGAGYAAGRLIGTDLQAECFALATLDNQCKLVVGAVGDQLRFVVETGGPSPRWHAPVTVHFAGLASAAEITQVHTARMDEDVLVGVLARYENKIGPDTYCFWVGKWTGNGLFFRSSPVDLNSDDPVANEFLYQGHAAAYV
jgi:hypothetical protein